MKNKKKNIYEKYFGTNIARIVFLISCGVLFFGAFNILMGNSYGGTFFCIIGVIPFFCVYHLQVSDKQIDELVNKTEEEYLDNNIKGKIMNKQELNPKNFTTFSGFIRNDGNVRFKSCKDGKMRTSRYYITAISTDKKECIVSTTIYDLISDEVPTEQFICVASSEIIELITKESEFPKGNFECTLRVQNESCETELHFYLPSNDYAAKQLIKKINDNTNLGK